MTCIVLNYLRSLLIICLCVSLKTWQAPLLNPSASLFCDSISYCVSVQRRDRCTVFSSSILAALSQCVCPKTWQVTALSLHCSTKVQFLFSLSWIRSFTFDLFLDNFSLLIAQCICPKTWQVLCLLSYSGSDHSHFAILASLCVCPKTWQVHSYLLPNSGPFTIPFD